MDDDFCGLACPPLDLGFGSDGFGGCNFFDVIEDGEVSLDNLFDNVELDDVCDPRIVSDDEVRFSDSNLRNPNSDLGVKQQRSVIKSPNSTLVHGKGKQLPLPHLMTGPEKIVSGKGKQLPPPHLVTCPEKIVSGKGKQLPSDLGVKQQGKKIKSPMTTIVHGKGKQLPPPHLLTDPEKIVSCKRKQLPPDLGVQQQGKKIKSPMTTLVHSKGKQLPLPHRVTGPEKIVFGKGKQLPPLHLTGPEPQQAHDSNHHSTFEVVPSVIDSIIPKVESTKRTGMAKPEESIGMNTVAIKHSVTGIDYEYKLELSKRKLQESYGAAQQAKRQRRIVVLDFPPSSEKPSLQQRSCQGGRFRTKKLQRLYNDCKSRPCLI